VRLCLGIHPTMPGVARLGRALRAMDAGADETDAWKLNGPLVVRWNLHSGFEYEGARQRYAPFDRIVDADPLTRAGIVHLVQVAQRSGQQSFVIVGNNAEGCAPQSCFELARALAAR
jgi:hypothetical protein